MKLTTYGIFLIVFFGAALLQVSFFPYFAIAGAVPNVIFVVFFLTVFFREQSAWLENLLFAAIAGFFMDLLLGMPFGTSAVCFFVVAVITLGIMHLFHNISGNALIWYFAGLFVVAFLLQGALLYAASRIMQVDYHVSLSMVIALGYSLALAVPGCIVWQKFSGQGAPKNQLKLL